MRITRTTLTLVVAGALALVGCGGDDDASDTAADAADELDEALAEAPADDEPADDEPAEDTDGEVPDPCTLIPSDDLAALLGSDPGEGTVGAVVPDQRKICTYPTGLILAVEIADNYEASVDLIRENSGGATIEDVAGVGSAAIWQDFGGVGQFVAKGDTYFVGVTVPSGGKEMNQAVAEAMLAAL